MNDKIVTETAPDEVKYHAIIHLTPTEIWKLKMLAVKNRITLKKLLQETLRKIIEEEN